MPAAALARTAASWGAVALLYTDVARDGLQVGAALESTAALQRGVEIPVTMRRGLVASAQVSVMGARSEPTTQVWGRREITL